MAEANRFSQAAFANTLDRGIRDVMPESWEGHARIVARESDAVPESKVNAVVEKAANIAEGHDSTTLEEAANLLVENIEEQRS